MNPAQRDRMLRPGKKGAVPGLRPDRAAFQPLSEDRAGFFLPGLPRPRQPLTAEEAEAWDALAGPCCYYARSEALRLGIRRGADGKWHLEHCAKASPGPGRTIAEAAAEDGVLRQAAGR